MGKANRHISQNIPYHSLNQTAVSCDNLPDLLCLYIRPHQPCRSRYLLPLRWESVPASPQSRLRWAFPFLYGCPASDTPICEEGEVPPDGGRVAKHDFLPLSSLFSSQILIGLFHALSDTTNIPVPLPFQTPLFRLAQLYGLSCYNAYSSKFFLIDHLKKSCGLAII